MSRDTTSTERRLRTTRRNALRALGAGIVATGGLVGSAGAAERSVGVAPETAQTAAQLAAVAASGRTEYDDLGFAPEAVGSPTLYYGLTSDDEYVPAVYVCPVVRDGDDVGHITVGARESMPPIVEYGTDPAPHRRREAIGGALGQSLDGRLLYQSPLAFGVVVDGRAVVDLGGGFSYGLDIAGRVDPGAGADHADAWATVESLSKDDLRDAPFETADSGTIYGVPNWSDYNDDWSGCSPIAASMAIGYHEGTSYYDRDELIDALNDSMNTDSEGLTWPWNIPSGIEGYDPGYDATNHYIGRPGAATGGVDDDEPPIVSTLGDKEAGKNGTPAPEGWDLPVGHTETVVGYEEEDSWFGTDLYLDTHNTWGGTRTLLVGGYLDTYMITTVSP